MESGFEQEVRELYQRGDLHINLPAIRSWATASSGITAWVSAV